MIMSEIISFYSLYSMQTKPVNIIVTRSAKCESVTVKCVL